MAAFGILGMCNWVSNWYRPGGSVSLADLTRGYTALALGGLAAKPKEGA